MIQISNDSLSCTFPQIVKIATVGTGVPKEFPDERLQKRFHQKRA